MSSEEFDQRMGRLAERHQTLTETVEHLARKGEEQNSRIDRLLGIVESLAAIAQNHERRIEGLEG